MVVILAGQQLVLGSSHKHHHHHFNLHDHEIKSHDKHIFGTFRPTKLFVFGDSYSDTGNTRKSQAYSWKYPYGITFPGKPTGRYSDGRVFTDFLGTFSLSIYLFLYLLLQSNGFALVYFIWFMCKIQ